MNLKKAMVVILAAGMITASFTACSQNNKENVKEATATTASQVQNGKDGEPQTEIESEVVTNAKGETKVVTKVVTKKNDAATKASQAKSSKKTSKAQASANASKTTTKKASGKSTPKNSAKSSKKSNAKSANLSNNQMEKVQGKSDSKTTAKVETTTKVTTTEAKETIVTLEKNGNAKCTNSKVSIDSSGYGKITIDSPGDYTIKSDTDVWHGQIVVKLKNTESADIRIENVNIATQNANAIQIIDTSIDDDRSFIEADVSSGTSGAGDTDNALQDAMKDVSKKDKAPNVSLSFPTNTSSSFSTSANVISGVLYNESKLTIKGSGKVSFESQKNNNNAIASTKSITFKNVDATLTTPLSSSPSSGGGSKRGIFCYSKVNVESGSLTIHSNGDGIRCEEFNSTGGTTTIKSSASDGIDSDDAIIITDGNVTVEALQKSCLKVRRVNNQKDLNDGKKGIKADDCIKKEDHTFKIDGGTVTAMGKNITTLKSVSSKQKTSSQASIVCKSVKAAGSEEAKKAISFAIKGSGVSAESSQKCIKFLYSSPSIDTSKEYTVSSKGYDSQKVSFTGKAGIAKITASV